MVSGLLMELDDHNCWTIAEAAGHRGPHRLQHLLSRAVWDDQQVLDIAAAWAAGHLDDGDAVLIVDETADEKSSTDAAGAARQYSGTVGGIALCQVAVTLTYATSRGHALIGRALYLPEACAGDEEHRDLAGVPEEVLFADGLLDRAHSRGTRAAFVTGDEVYGGRELRCGIRRRGMGYVLAVRANHTITAGAGRTLTVAEAVPLIPAGAWHRMRTGSGSKGTRHYDWAMLEVTSDDTPDGHDGGHSVLLARRHRYTGKLSFYRCWTPGPVPLSRLIAIAVTRWRIEMVFSQLAKGCVGAIGRGWQHVADLDLVAGDDHAVDEQFGQLTPLGEGGGCQPGADSPAEGLDPVADSGQFQSLLGGGFQLALLSQERVAAAV
jgi:SRSO17 transposase